MSDDLDGFQELQLQSTRTLFMFYGYRMARDGELGSGYFKHAHSLNEALADLIANPGVLDEGGYLVRDAFLELGDDDDPCVHVDLLSARELRELLSEES